MKSNKSDTLMLAEASSDGIWVLNSSWASRERQTRSEEQGSLTSLQSLLLSIKAPEDED